MLESRAARGWRFIEGSPGVQSSSENLIAAAAFFLFFLAWAAAESILNADRALHYDLFEAYAWGKEFQLGYNQHGPFWAWIAGAWFLLFPNTNTSFVLLQALNATLGLFGAWMLIGLFTKGWERHAATLLLVATPFYTFNAYKYNANTIFISLWPWTLYFFIRSVDLMSRRDALIFGVFAAACILSKYYAVLLLATCGLSLFVHPNGRRYLFSPLPWIAGAIFSLLVLPHLVWSLTSSAPPVAYAMGLTGKGWLFTGQHVARFVFDLLLFQAAVVALVFLASVATRQTSDCRPGQAERKPGSQKDMRFNVLRSRIRLRLSGTAAAILLRGAAEPVERLPQWRRRFLAVLVLAPPLLTIMAALIFQLKIEAIMAIGIFPLMPLFLMQLVTPLDGRGCFYLAGGAAVALTIATLAAAPFAGALMASKKAGPSFAFPYRELAASVTEVWRSETHTPLKYIGADTHTANGISFYSPDRPSSFVNLDYARALWVTPAKLEQNGLLIACVHEDAACLSKASNFLKGHWKQTSLKIAREFGTRRMPEVTFDIFVIPPLAG
ncbi:MAG: glycosyltransferase family 39 protein [Rhodomicrobium sp.]